MLYDDDFIPILLSDQSLTTLEKIYLFSRSNQSYHRLFIAHALPSFLQLISPQDALQYVLPLLTALAIDNEDSVKETLAQKLVPLIWWFFTHCQLVTDDSSQQDPSSTTISVQAFTPILGTLLLSQNGLVGGAARYAVVDILKKLRSDDVSPDQVGLFGIEQRKLFEQEVLQQVVIGMGRLDIDDSDPAVVNDVNTDDQPPLYFPALPSPSHAIILPVSPSSPEITALSPPPPIIPVHTDPSRIPQAPLLQRSIGSVLEVYPSPDDSHWPAPRRTCHTPSPPNQESDQALIDPEEEQVGEQAAVGRLSSMSLMAAVTASGSIDEDTKHAFVKEVERVGRDPVYWVRREASFTLGALAKVVPEEVVICSLLPVFENLRLDPVWHVRHSALFALPAILSRLPPRQRRALALNTVISLSTDEYSAVRSGVLEALGEVIYTFHEDEGGPPEELVHLFLGRTEDRRIRDGSQSVERPSAPETPSLPTLKESALDWFYDDPARPLICAFNYPSVALTLGRPQWNGKLREVYLQLAENRTVLVRKTLAASLGELAKIIGAENARRDLVGVWWDAIRCEEEEVRMKAVECVEVFLGALGNSNTRGDIVQGLLEVWNEGVFKGWREREGIAKALVGFTGLVGTDRPAIVRGLLKTALEDSVAAVREMAVAAVPQIQQMFSDRPDVQDDLRDDIGTLANSGSHRRRMTFVACQQALIFPGRDGQPVFIPDDIFWRTLTPLCTDSIVGVRIGVARLVGSMCDVLVRKSLPVASTLRDLVRQLALDVSREVRSFVLGFDHAPGYVIPLLLNDSYSKKRNSIYSTFSRPPGSRPQSSSAVATSLRPGKESESVLDVLRPKESTGLVGSAEGSPGPGPLRESCDQVVLSSLEFAVRGDTVNVRPKLGGERVPVPG